MFKNFRKNGWKFIKYIDLENSILSNNQYYRNGGTENELEK